MVGNGSSTKWKVARAFPRFALDIPFDLGVVRGRMLDIGLGGFAGVLSTDVTLRQKMTAEFQLPGAAGPIQVKVIVRHHEGPRYGFEFLDISRGQRDLIRQACQGLAII